MIKREYDSRLDKWNVFQEKSTYLNDYRWLTPDERTIYRWPRERTEVPPKPAPSYNPIDNETFIKWRKGVHVPFDLLWEPKPITGTNPREKIGRPKEIVDEQKDEAIKTRPRIYMGPAVSMDDIPDEEMRALLIKFMYTTDWKRATEEAAPTMAEKKIPTQVAESYGDPVKLNVGGLTSLPEGWREKGKTWDKDQARALVDPTKEFWFNKDPPVKCGACVNPVHGLVTKETKQKIHDLIETDRLRIAHDYTKPGYTGYRPRMTRGVPLEKKDLHFTHPLLSVAQTMEATKTEEIVQLI